jgi:uncharacterized damage-inducible protein DinB
MKADRRQSGIREGEACGVRIRRLDPIAARRKTAMTIHTRSVHHRFAFLAVTLALLLTALPAAAQDEGGSEMAMEGHGEMEAMTPTAVPPALSAAMVADFGRAADKLMQLAEAFPQEKWSWRPAEGIRSVSEAFMHVANANFGLAAVLGVDKPADLPEDLEAVTDKAQALELLETSLDHARKAIENSAGGDMAAEHEMFGRTMTSADVVMILISHNHEHLGQAIAYARSVGVVPPWSEG